MFPEDARSTVSARPVRRTVGVLCLLFAPLAIARPAFAHASERGFVLLLPTGYYIAGGTFAVAASFILFLLVPGAAMHRLAAARVGLWRVPPLPTTAISMLAFLVLAGLLAAGFLGSHDPLANPLPLAVWTVWWGGVTIAHALLGNLWAAINPWSGPCRLLRRLGSEKVPLAYPAWLGYAPAALTFLAFAWFELVDPAPDNPPRLAVVVALYWAATLLAMLLFGERAWLARGECFAVFFGFVARLAPLRTEQCRLRLAFPGATLAAGEPLPLGGMLFILLTLATVSFDGLSHTFWWLGLGGINPLEFPGRTAVMGRNSLGLLGMWAALVGGYTLAILLGARLAGANPRHALGAFVLTILPISIGYHFAHYLTAFLVNVQYAVRALGDPFGQGWDLLGLGRREVTVSFLSDYGSVSIIWRLQAAGVVLGHILAISLAHLVAVKRIAEHRRALLIGLPLALLMVGYTLFGLWLLAAPTAG
jgi:hypothetical protein